MTLIYYFSGTGNSLAAARDVATGLGADVQRMADAPDGLSIPAEADAVGFAYPNYDFRAPKYVEEWLRRVKGLEGRYLFALCTYGISAGDSLSRFDRLVRARGGALSAGFAVLMPHNGIGSALQPASVREAILDEWNGRIDEVVAAISRRECRPLESGSRLGGFLRHQAWRMLPGLFRYLGVWMREGEAGLAYRADDACTSCGVCARFCPVENITMHSARPVWGTWCTNCFGCLHWCPAGAIHLGTANLQIDHPYHHPSVSVRDMLRAEG